MRRSEALAELELGEHATPAEIKAAYRDLVKVWHPDRFGSDVRLRQRAEERLQQINDAYQALESGALDPEPVGGQDAASAPPRARVRTEAERDALLRLWVYVAIVVVMGALVGYGVVEYRRQMREDAEAMAAQAAMRTAQSPAPRESAAGNAGAVRSTAREHAGPELSGLTAGERTSVEHVCAQATSYSDCAAAQIASLSSVSPRPDVSRMSTKDRSAIERACSSARDHDGPAAYDRCVVEVEKMLATQ